MLNTAAIRKKNSIAPPFPMSKALQSILPVFVVFATILQTSFDAPAQDVDVTIEILDENPRTAKVIGRILSPRIGATNRNLSLVRSGRLGERFSNIYLGDSEGKSIPFLTPVQGEYVAEKPFAVWSYTVKLPSHASPTHVAPASWLSAEEGVLAFADLLPQFDAAGVKVSVRTKLRVPERWTAFSELSDKNLFETDDLSKTIAYVGKDLAMWPTYVGGRRLNIVRDGEWVFDDRELTGSAQEIYGRFRGIFGHDSQKDVQVALYKFPPATSSGLWQANTLGRNITIVSSDTPFKSQSLQRLHEQLRHEMFHLWIPEGVNLTGNYDWFYEGFALYQSLKLGVAVNRLRFEDYLDSLSQAVAMDRRLGGKMSLIDASKNRWSGDNNSVVYARGMLVAFLCDLAILEASKGKRSTDEIVREVYRRHTGEATPRDGNEAMMELMRSNKELVPIVERYVIGTEKLDLTSLLTAAGLGSADGITLKTVAKPNSRQKKLLDKLGYNNWRKLPSTRK